MRAQNNFIFGESLEMMTGQINFIIARSCILSGWSKLQDL